MEFPIFISYNFDNTKRPKYGLITYTLQQFDSFKAQVSIGHPTYKLFQKMG